MASVVAPFSGSRASAIGTHEKASQALTLRWPPLPVPEASAGSSLCIASSRALLAAAASCGLSRLRRSQRCRHQAAQASPRVAVIGAGPAGLATALALRKEAKLEDVTVLERSPELRRGTFHASCLAMRRALHSLVAILESFVVEHPLMSG